MRGCLLIGCGVVALIVLAVLGSGGFFVWKTWKSTDAALTDARATNTEFPFTAPADGLILPEKFGAFLRVRAASTAALRSMSEKVHGLQKGTEGGGATFRKVMDTMSSASRMMGDTFTALAAALRAEHMSLAELQWITKTAHGAVACTARTGDKDALALVDAIQNRKEGDVTVGGGQHGGGYPELRARLEQDCAHLDPRNFALVLAHRDEFVGDPVCVDVDLFAIGGIEKQK